MNKTLLLALLGLIAICRPSFAADNLSKTNAVSSSSVEVKCQMLTVPVKDLENIGFRELSEQSMPGLAGIFSKDQSDVLWKALKGKEGVLVEGVGDITVKSGESEKIQKGYDFSYPVDYDATGKPKKMETRFLGIKLELKPSVSDGPIDLSVDYKVTQLKEMEITQAFMVNESDLINKPTFEELVSTFAAKALNLTPSDTLPKKPAFNPVFNSRSMNGGVMLYTGQSAFYSMDDYENTGIAEKGPPQKLKLKDPSKRRFLIITATVIEPRASKH